MSVNFLSFFIWYFFSSSIRARSFLFASTVQIFKICVLLDLSFSFGSISDLSTMLCSILYIQHTSLQCVHIYVHVFTVYCVMVALKMPAFMYLVNKISKENEKKKNQRPKYIWSQTERYRHTHTHTIPMFKFNEMNVSNRSIDRHRIQIHSGVFFIMINKHSICVCARSLLRLTQWIQVLKKKNMKRMNSKGVYIYSVQMLDQPFQIQFRGPIYKIICNVFYFIQREENRISILTTTE